MHRISFQNCLKTSHSPVPSDIFTHKNPHKYFVFSNIIKALFFFYYETLLEFNL